MTTRVLLRCPGALLSLLALAMIACGAGLAAGADIETQPVAARRVVAHACWSRLSPAALAVLEPMRDRVVDVAVGVAGDVAGGLPPQAHYVMLDVGAPDAPIDKRLDAAAQFPADRARATQWFARHGQHNGGTLPWTLAEQCEALTDAVRRDDRELVATRAGLVIQLATDAALPFNATARRSRQSHAVSVAPESKLGGYADVALPCDRLHGWFIRKMDEPLLARVEARRAAPARLTDPTPAALALLIDALVVGDLMITADAELIDLWRVKDDARFRQIERAYLEEMDRRCGALMAAQLSAAADLATALIDAAVTTPGRAPVLSGTPGTRPPLTSSAPRPPLPAAVLVGSKNSTVFHHRDCRHAAKIKPENMVTFASAEAARQAGRQPCSVCKPDQSP